MERRRELQESQGLESQEELEAQGVVHNNNTNRTTLTSLHHNNNNSRRRVALHPPEAQQRETRRLRTWSPPSFSSSVQTTSASLPWVQEPSRFPFLSWLSSRNSSSHTRSENRRRNNNPWRSNLSDTEGRRDSRVGTQDDDFVSLDYSWLYNMDGIENEEEQRQQGRRALWRRIISRAPVYSGRNRSIRNNTSNNNNSDTDPADMDPEEYVYHSAWLPSQSLGRNRPSRVYLSSATRDERQDSFLRPMQEETPTNEMHRAQALDTSWVFRGEEEERDNPSWEADTTWNGTSHMAYGHQMMNETEEDLFSSESSSDQEIASRPSGTRFVVRFANRSFETTLGGRDEQEQRQSTLTNSSLLETEEEEEGENVECSSSRLQFLLGSDGPEDSRTYRLVISRFGLTGLILYRNLMTCGPFYPRSPARLLVHLAGYFLFFKDYSVVSSRAHLDPSFLSRLLSLEESEAARLFDHLKMRDPMKLLMDRLPPFFLLKRAIRGKRPFFHQGREALVIKFVLDIYVYYFQREVPLFETYRRKVLPLVQLFYTSISQSILDNVCYQQSKVLERMKWMMDWSDSNGFGLASSNHHHHPPHSNSGGGCEDIRDCWRKEFLFLPSRESYIEYYNHISRRLCNLTESLSISSLLV